MQAHRKQIWSGLAVLPCEARTYTHASLSPSIPMHPTPNNLLCSQMLLHHHLSSILCLVYPVCQKRNECGAHQQIIRWPGPDHQWLVWVCNKLNGRWDQQFGTKMTVLIYYCCKTVYVSVMCNTWVIQVGCINGPALHVLITHTLNWCMVNSHTVMIM